MGFACTGSANIVRSVLVSAAAGLAALAVSFAASYALFLVVLPSDSDVGREVFARAFIGALGAFAVAAFLLHPPEGRGRRRLAAYALVGVLFALLDPLHAIRAEENVIRYFTAAPLAVAGLICLHGTIARGRLPVDRAIALLLGLLFLTGAADELLHIHEMLGSRVGALSEGDGVAGQDLVTLVAAGAGVAGAFAMLWLILFLSRRGLLGFGPRHERAIKVFVAACVLFLAAMLLDSFDTVLEAELAAGLGALLPGSRGAIGVLAEAGYVAQAANSLEECLEFLAACLFLATSVIFVPVRGRGAPALRGRSAP